MLVHQRVSRIDQRGIFGMSSNRSWAFGSSKSRISSTEFVCDAASSDGQWWAPTRCIQMSDVCYSINHSINHSYEHDKPKLTSAQKLWLNQGCTHSGGTIEWCCWIETGDGSFYYNPITSPWHHIHYHIVKRLVNTGRVRLERIPSGNLLHSHGKRTIYRWIFPLKMVMFHSYVNLPEGNLRCTHNIR